jgi:hypothetical protein
MKKPITFPTVPLTLASVLAASLLAPGCATDAGPDDLATETIESDVGGLEQAFPGRTGPIEKRRVQRGDELVEVNAQIIDGYAVVEGDMVFDSPEAAQKGTARAAGIIGHRWPGGVIPYVISPNLPDHQRVFDAMAKWEAATPIRFIAYTNQPQHVLFMPDAANWSYVGNQGWGEQGIRISTTETVKTSSGAPNLIGIAIAHSNDHVYYFYRDVSDPTDTHGFVSSGTSTDSTAYTPLARFSVPSDLRVSNIADIAINSDDHVYTWFKNGAKLVGTSTDLDHYERGSYTSANGISRDAIIGIGIADDDDVYTWYSNGKVSRGNSSDLDKYEGAYSYALPPGRTAADVIAIDIAPSNDHVFSWFADGRSTAGKVTIGNSSDLDKYAAAKDFKLSGGCGSGCVAHEIGHAIGLFHEQARADRDRFVTVKYENVEDGHDHDFDHYGSGDGVDWGTFDFDSIMLYSSFAFSKNGLPTLVKKSDGSTFVGQRNHLGANDILAVDLMY